ncbi:MAG: hypothetical protein IPK21_03970 [Haliscomenobacter sp.]|nr:hypothetical protein [Haliscomenobacter sp.]
MPSSLHRARPLGSCPALPGSCLFQVDDTQIGIDDGHAGFVVLLLAERQMFELAADALFVVAPVHVG